MFQVLGIIFGVVSIVPILKFIDEGSMTRTEKMVYPIIGLFSLLLCAMFTLGGRVC